MSKLTISCGSIEDINTLVDLGVDDIQITLKNSAFSALPSFSYEEIIDIRNKYNIKLAVNMNALFSESDIEEKENIMLKLLDNGIDYIVFSDFGLLNVAKKHNYENKMIYDPITLLTNSLEAKVLKETGIAYITISSLLTKEEIIDIANSIDNASLVIHGHLLMSATKRKLLTEYEKEKNISLDGDIHYIEEETRDALMPIYENEVGTLVYSDFIQESFKEIIDFDNAGIKRFVIDTINLDIEEIIETIKTYQRILNGEDIEEVIEDYKNKVENKLLSKGYYAEKSIK